jgi:hypothetical protein
MSKTIPIVTEEFEAVFDQMLKLAFTESQRGAIVIGAGLIENQLEELVKSALPKDSKKYQKRLLDYPGQLSSFNSKIELAFAFRLIPENIRIPLNHIRSIRNTAAHSTEYFKVSEDEISKITDFGPGFRNMILTEAIKMMLANKQENFKKIMEENEWKLNDVQDIWIESLNSEEAKEQISEQSFHWRFALGLSILASFIGFYKKNIISNIEKGQFLYKNLG